MERSGPAVKRLMQIADGSLDAIREGVEERGRRRHVSTQDLGLSLSGAL
jgi:hypothetical protein